jgi:hypothetical protein
MLTIQLAKGCQLISPKVLKNKRERERERENMKDGWMVSGWETLFYWVPVP